MAKNFSHHFKNGMGPFVTRSPTTSSGQDTPASDDAAKIVNGKLELRLLLDPMRVGHVWVPPWQFDFTTGFFEFRAKFPAPRGVHSAGWLQSPTPMAGPDDHEVDVGEHFGDDRNVYRSVWQGPWNSPKQIYTSSSKIITPGNWNVYGVECREKFYRFYVNNVEVGFTVGIGSTRPKGIILSLLSDKWEASHLETNLDKGLLPQYYALFDWVRVKE